MSNDVDKFSRAFAEYVDEAVKAAIGVVFDKALEEAMVTAENKRDEVIASSALKISSLYRLEDMGTTLRIEVRKPEKES